MNKEGPPDQPPDCSVCTLAAPGQWEKRKMEMSLRWVAICTQDPEHVILVGRKVRSGE